MNLQSIIICVLIKIVAEAFRRLKRNDDKNADGWRCGLAFICDTADDLFYFTLAFSSLEKSLANQLLTGTQFAYLELKICVSRHVPMV